MWKPISILAVLALALGIAAVPMAGVVEGQTACNCGDICVNTTGWWPNGGNFIASGTPIQDAVNNASGGDIICVKDGNYNENVDVDTAGLTIQSENGTASCVVNAANSSDHVFSVTADLVNITGFTVQNATGVDKAGIHLYLANHCNISSNNATNNSYGIRLTSSDNNNFTGNDAWNNTRGICLGYSSNNTLTDNNAWNNSCGIYLGGSDNNNLTNNTVYNTWYGIRLDSLSNSNTLTNNNVSNNALGIWLIDSHNNVLTSNNVSNNAEGIKLGGLYIGNITLSSNNNLIYNNYFNNTNNAWDDGTNTWNIAKTAGTNIINGSWLGGNYWSDYAGIDTNEDGLGDTLLPYDSSWDIMSGGDWLPLVPPGVGAPEISVNSANFAFEAVEQGFAPENQTLEVWNSGINGSTLNWTLFDENTTWLGEQPMNGISTGPGDKNPVNVSVNIAGLSAGVYYDNITITAPEAINSPQTVPVTLYIYPYIYPAPARTLPHEVLCPGNTFNVTITWTTKIADVTALLLVDFAPAGWGTTGHNTWCTPLPNVSKAYASGKIEYTWNNTFPVDTDFTAIYEVTVPGGATPGDYSFSDGILYYYVNGTGPLNVSVIGDTNVTVGCAPVADFTANETSGLVPLSVQFNDTSTGNPTSWDWDFGDGNYSAVQNLVHTYTANGIYNVTLNASNDCGLDITTKVDYITANFATCNCGDICVNTIGWWHNGSAFNASATPIQDAVDNAIGGETICVKDGNYTENIDVGTASLTIQSENGTANCVVNASNSNDHVFEVTVDLMNITGFTVKDATGSGKAGIYLGSGVEHCNISSNNVTDNNRGIYLLTSNYTNLTDNTVWNNSWDGIYLDSSYNTNLIDNNATNNHYGIYLTGSSNDNTLTNNTAWNNTRGIRLDSSSNNNLTNNTANSNAQDGIYLRESSNNNLTNNTAMNNDEGIHMHSSSNNNNLINNTVNWNNHEGIFVTNSSSNNFTNNIANSNGQHGIYLGNSNNNTLTDNTANSNPLSGIHLGNSSNNNLTDNTANSSNCDGIQLYDSSNNTLANNTAWNNSYGIYLSSSSNNNNLTNNTAWNNTRGISLRNSSNCNNLIDNTVPNNYYGIYLDYSSNNTLTDNTVWNNSWDGIYLYSSSNNNNLTNNTVEWNTHYGICLRSSSSNNLTSNTANSNGPFGIFLWISSNNNNLTNNTANENDFDGIYLSSSSNNNLINNTANSNSIGVSLWNSSNNNLIDNTVSENSERGVCLVDANNTTLMNNILDSNDCGIHLCPESDNITLRNNTFTNNGLLFDSFHYNHTVEDNTVNGKPLVYFKEVFNQTITDAGQVILIKCANITVENLDLCNATAGVQLIRTDDSRIVSNKISHNLVGISSWCADGNTIENNTVNWNGPKKGATWLGWGIYFSDSSNNTLTNNTANWNYDRGIYLESGTSKNNTIYNNYFNNTNNAWDEGTNIWNITKTAGTNIIGGPYLGGNYWSDYAGADLNGDGLGDTLLPYDSSGNIQIGGDWRPLVPTVGATLDGHLSFPGTAAGRGMTVSFFDNSTQVEELWSPLSATTDASGNFTIGSLPPGTYDLSVKNWTCLSEVELGIVLSAGATTYVDFGSSREGDSDGNNGINIADISITIAAYATTPGDGNWDANCDYNRDSGVNIADISIMIANYGDSGDPYPP